MLNSLFLRLTSIHRFSNERLTVKDTDADHTIRMQLMALEIYKDNPNSFDIKETCFKILMHDVDEVCMCDIPRNVKYHDSEIRGSIARVTNQLLDSYGIKGFLRECIDNSKDSSIEGNIVKVLDVVDAFVTLNNETWVQRSEHLAEHARSSLDYLESVGKTFPTTNLELFDYIQGIVEECKKEYNRVQEILFSGVGCV